MRNPFHRFNNSPEVTRLTVMMYFCHPLSLRQVEDLLLELGLDICYETVRFWWNRFDPMLAAEIKNDAFIIVRIPDGAGAWTRCPWWHCQRKILGIFLSPNGCGYLQVFCTVRGPPRIIF